MRCVGGRLCLGLFLATILGLASCGGDSTAPPPPANLQEALEAAIADHGIPALGAVVIQDDQVTLAVAGVRKRGTSDAVQPGDLWHLGSNTKAITATLVAILVERDSLRWNTRVLNVFPELAGSADQQYNAITLADLLHHRAAIPAFEELEDYAVLPDFPGTIEQQRAAFTTWLLERAPATTPGQYLYSNASYAVVASMAERVMGKSWEELIEELVFTPWGSTAGSAGRASPVRTSLGGTSGRARRWFPTIPTASTRSRRSSGRPATSASILPATRPSCNCTWMACGVPTASSMPAPSSSCTSPSATTRAAGRSGRATGMQSRSSSAARAPSCAGRWSAPSAI